MVTRGKGSCAGASGVKGGQAFVKAWRDNHMRPHRVCGGITSALFWGLFQAGKNAIKMVLLPRNISVYAFDYS